MQPIRNQRGFIIQLVVGLIVGLFALLSYFFTTDVVENPITGESQRVSLTPTEEIALGLEAVSEISRQYGGLHPDRQAQALVDQIGQRLVDQSAAGQTGYRYEFHLLADSQTINAFALPGGQIFITQGLFQRLSNNNELAGVLAHEIGHVAARHAAERIAKAKLTEGLTGAAVIATYDPDNSNSLPTRQMAALVGQMVNMKYSRDDELQSDRLGVDFMIEAGFDPRGMLRVMEVLADAGAGNRLPDFFSTHPNPANRLERLRKLIAERSQ